MAFAYAAFFLLVICIYKPVSSQQNHSNLISLGSSISTNVQPTSWRSPSGTFAFGFYPQGSGFIVGIWLVGKPADIITWTAYRDDPPVPSNATLELTVNGKLLLRTYYANNEAGEEKLIAKIEKSASNAGMLDSGNLVLYNEHSDVIWESFNFPTDTILGGQNLYAGGELLSSASTTDFSTGRFRLKMQSDGNLVLYPIDTIDTSVDAYWNAETFGSSGAHLYLNYTSGELLILNKTSGKVRAVFYSDSEPESSSIIYRATLESDGIFKLYSHNFDRNGAYTTSLKDHAPESQCQVKTFCGLNSYCTMNDDQPDCRCLPGTVPVHPDQRYNGCKRNYTEQLCKVAEETSSYNIIDMEKMTCYDIPYFVNSTSEEDCRKSCLQDCNCAGAMYEDGDCMKMKFPVKYASRYEDDDQYSSKVFFKVGLKSVGSAMKPPVVHKTSKKTVTLIFVMSVAFITCSSIAIAASVFFISKSRVVEARMRLGSGNLGLAHELSLRAFSYRELKNATKGFREELGKGSFGAVYKGTLYKGKKVIAVKRLEKLVSEGEREFLTEMRSIGKTHHKNLVRLLGYCTEDSQRLLVYEYMSNGSLADLLFRTERIPNWSHRVKIALDIARGILYLHEECEAPIIHCDIKPQNILMDDFWNAKISDFGLAKLLVPDQTRTFTIVRGTRGYLAPEWHKNTPISVKADVYSYGVMLLEIVFCRRNIETNVSRPEEVLLSNWAYELMVARELDKLDLGEDVDLQNLEKMVMVGMWCIQDEPGIRPSMKSVVLMLEGITDVSVPPHPTSASA
ncbi:G-type lectin S-receptor-like serine/threonine-protein kinase LECRK1 [Populus alba x Populus x berolinensis]|uniref:Receptor-like serine/threonine-protein kinase n=1 Tax=Populus alba x Populus x berolinensis TaxID=444605 RepID=A0AAD6PN69_9ROSI|nr:G-type lectin S-receptor-like serine/threonine-protein kinase LECRK1 [Populus alba x Populus x berolinensis]